MDRIAIVTTSYPRWQGDPSGHFVEAEVRALVRAGHPITVVTGGAHSEVCTLGEGSTGVRILRIADGGASGWPGILPRLRDNPLRAIGLVRWLAAATRTLQREGPFSRVIAHWLLPSAFPIAFSAKSGARLEVVVHGSDARLLASLPRAVSKALLGSLIQRGAEFRCVSQELLQLIHSLAGPGALPRTRVEPSPLALDQVPDRGQARARLEIRAGTRLVVIVSRLIAEKRVREALAAARLVPDLSVVVVGDGPELGHLKTQFPEARFLGTIAHDQALSWIAAADVLLSASRLEGAPTAIREARALGVRVVASGAGDLTRWAERDSGLYVVS